MKTKPNDRAAAPGRRDFLRASMALSAAGSVALVAGCSEDSIGAVGNEAGPVGANAGSAGASGGASAAAGAPGSASAAAGAPVGAPGTSAGAAGGPVGESAGTALSDAAAGGASAAPTVTDPRFECVEVELDASFAVSRFPAQTVEPAPARDGSQVYEITCDQIPNHSTGVFPNASDPWPILPMRRTWRFPMNPETDPEKIQALVPTPTNPPTRVGGVFGLAINGVRFHTNAPFWKTLPSIGWQYEQTADDVGAYYGIDHNNAHTHPDDGYHYHGIPWGLIDLLSKEKAESGSCAPMLFLGWAADGYPIYAPFVDPDYFCSQEHGPLSELRSSYRLKTGARPQPTADDPGQPGGIYDGTFALDFEYVAGSGDLDECNGRFGRTPEYPDGIYYYVITRDFPMIPRSWRGVPNESFILPPPLGEPSILMPLMGPTLNWQPRNETDLLGNPGNSALFRESSRPENTSTRAPIQSITTGGYCYLFMVSSRDDKIHMCSRADGSLAWSQWTLLPDQNYGALENSQAVSLDVVQDTVHVTQTVTLPGARSGPYPYSIPHGLPTNRMLTVSGRLQGGAWMHVGTALDSEP